MQTIRINNFDDLEYRYVETCLRRVILNQSDFDRLRCFSGRIEFSDKIVAEYYARKTKNGFVLDIHKIEIDAEPKANS